MFAVAAFTRFRSSADLSPFASSLVTAPERPRLRVAGVVAKVSAEVKAS
ncbi:hypothetical protein [Nonomuraea jabiensis]